MKLCADTHVVQRMKPNDSEELFLEWHLMIDIDVCVSECGVSTTAGWIAIKFSTVTGAQRMDGTNIANANMLKC